MLLQTSDPLDQNMNGRPSNVILQRRRSNMEAAELISLYCELVSPIFNGHNLCAILSGDSTAERHKGGINRTAHESLIILKITRTVLNLIIINMINLLPWTLSWRTGCMPPVYVNQIISHMRAGEMRRQLGDMFPALLHLRITMAYQACLLIWYSRSYTSLTPEIGWESEREHEEDGASARLLFVQM